MVELQPGAAGISEHKCMAHTHTKVSVCVDTYVSVCVYSSVSMCGCLLDH